MKPFLVLAAVAMAMPATASDPPPFTVGEIRVSTRNGTDEMELRYRLKGGRMRIDRPGESVPAPTFNLLDLCHNTLRIIHPRNGTWQEVLADTPAPSDPARPMPPPDLDLGPRHAPDVRPPGEPASVPPAPAMPGARSGIGPDFPRPPFLQARPGKLPPGARPGPIVPPIPMLGSMPVTPLELVDTGETREIHGYTCTRHTVVIPREGELTLWLAGPGLLPRFHLLVDDLPRQPSWELRVASLLREKDRFPLLAELHEDGQLLVRWEASSIHHGPVADDSLFEVPVSYHRLDPPSPPPFDRVK
jgi:hypothetical protein